MQSLKLRLTGQAAQGLSTLLPSDGICITVLGYDGTLVVATPPPQPLHGNVADGLALGLALQLLQDGAIGDPSWRARLGLQLTAAFPGLDCGEKG